MSNDFKPAIEMVKTAALVPYARNTKKHTPAQVDAVAKSITAFGFNAPVLIDPDNTIVAGHCRVLAATKLNMDKVPCIRLSHLDENQRKAYVIADNRMAEIGASWDYDMLRAELGDINFAGIVELREDDFGFGFYRDGSGDGAGGVGDGGQGGEDDHGDDADGRFILTYRNAEERDEWLQRIGSEETKDKYTVQDIAEEAP